MAEAFGTETNKCILNYGSLYGEQTTYPIIRIAGEERRNLMHFLCNCKALSRDRLCMPGKQFSEDLKEISCF